MKLIDKDVLVTEIERRKEKYITERLKAETINEKNILGARIAMLEEVLVLVNTLEVKEVNFKDVKSIFEGQYLSKDKVVTTIERLQDECEEQGDNNGVELLEKLFNKLDTLEVKEVDLEKEIGLFTTKELLRKRNHSTGVYHLTQNDIGSIAKHFFELGLKARKEE